MTSPNIKIITQFKLLLESIKLGVKKQKEILKEKKIETKKEEEIAKIEKKIKIDGHRIKQLNNIVKIFETIPFKIKNSDQVKDIPGIGKHTIIRIDEILEKGFLSEIEQNNIESTTKSIKTDKIIKELSEVIGIGEKTAAKLIEKYKIRSIDDLIKKYEKGKVELNDKLILGLKYYKKYKEHMPRNEIDKINILIQNIVKSISPKLTAVICGSYRRQKDFSNDIDILLVHQDLITMDDINNSKVNYLVKLIKKLSKPVEDNDNKAFLVDNLTDSGTTKYMGFCKYKKNPVRRLDIRYMPYESYYPALLYFTGSGDFNKKMRSNAIKLGYMLNEYGLFKKNKKTGEKKNIPVKSEKEIFDILGMEYLDPKDR
jgi:DNA polymerase/3'-5' exonuclease PolX